jgi:UDP-2,3-diacylglucosamine hydrolase
MEQSLEQRRAFAAHLRSVSKESSSNKAEDIMDVTPADVEQTMAAHGVKRLIHGHTHRPARHDEPGGSRWVLGDWDTKGWAIAASTDNIDLYDFDI